MLMPTGATRAGSETATMHVLVADDDAASAHFLCDAMQSLGAQTIQCTDGTSALAWARRQAFDLLLLDCRMPGAGALEIIRQLHADPQARSAESIAVATSAEITAADRAALLSAGFDDVLPKPCTLADLRRVLQLVPACGAAAVLDDATSLDASGNPATMLALRRLLRDELLALMDELETLGRDRTALGERLHRLRSSCGFCGAGVLSRRIVRLQQQMNQPSPDPVHLHRLRRAMQITVAALDG